MVQLRETRNEPGRASSLPMELLRCPFCGGTFNEDSSGLDSNQSEYGILTCDCSRFPVVAGIPVLRRDKQSEQAILLIESGCYDDALFTLIQPNSMRLPPIWRLASCLPLGHYLQRVALQQQRQQWRNRLAELLRRMARGERIPIHKLLDVYYTEKNHYWALRFGQPRYFIALSFASILPRSEKPILDLCCGHGHITRSLAYQANNQRVIGVDQSLWGLYVAKRWIAPNADYVCCSVEHALPFRDGTFSTVFSSDAFHYIKNKRSCVRECIRTMQDGVMIFTWVHNKRIRLPYDGVPLTPEGYHSLFQDLPHRLIADHDVLDRYFQQQGPNLSAQPDITYLDQKPLLSIVASTQADIFRDHGPFAEPPHAKGRLAINPIYRIETATGSKKTIRLRQTFPSRFYEEDHSEYKRYMPDNVELDATILENLAEEKRTVAVNQLIQQGVVLGMSDQNDSHTNNSLETPMPPESPVHRAA